MFMKFIYPFCTYVNMRICEYLVLSTFMFIKFFCEKLMSQSDVEKATFVHIGFSLVFIG